MARFLGILTGAALAALLLAQLVDIRSTGVDAPRSASVADTTVDDTTELPPDPERAVADASVTERRSVPALGDSSESEFAAEPAVADTGQTVAAPEPAVAESPEPSRRDAAYTAKPAAAIEWHSFWAPFRSELAADGFVARLQAVTGLDFRVVRQQAGRYEVEVAYSDAAELERHLQSIAGATGLRPDDARVAQHR